jgi:hypothetical protein
MSRAHDYQRLPRTSLEAQDLCTDKADRAPASSWLGSLCTRLPGLKTLADRAVYTHYVTPRHKKRSIIRLVYWTIFSFPYVCLLLVIIASIFFPSYTHRPKHYDALRQRALASELPGRANPHNEKVFIAASLYEDHGELTSGAWGRSVLQLVDLLGPDNVHLSVYEDNASAEAKRAMTEFQAKAACMSCRASICTLPANPLPGNSSVVADNLDLSTLPRTTLPTGETRLKRIAFLAEVRNRALAPIDSNGVIFDKILYINDVNFDPIDAAQLLLSTNIDVSGRTNYAAACAVDFINPFKFYDRFATRDNDGRTTGLPFYPWFTNFGSATSRNDVLSGSDAVRVRSCWSGMVAYEAKWFQDQDTLHPSPNVLEKAAKNVSTALTSPNPNGSPLRFRYEEETFWEASECCLINVDLQLRRSEKGLPDDSGIYMNPYIRVAYDEKTLSWLSLTRRPERLYPLIHNILNPMVGFPSPNPRIGEVPGQTVTDTVWEYDDPGKGLAKNATNADLHGHWTEVTRTATAGGFCGSRNLLVIHEKPEDGEGKWSRIAPPEPPKH